MRYRDKSFVNAMQWVIGLETFLLFEDPWRIFRIMAEFVDSFETMSRVGPAVTVFGSARMKPSDPCYQFGVEGDQGVVGPDHIHGGVDHQRAARHLRIFGGVEQDFAAMQGDAAQAEESRPQAHGGLGIGAEQLVPDEASALGVGHPRSIDARPRSSKRHLRHDL